MEERLRAWQMAQDLLDPIIEKHGLTEYRQGVMFQQVSTYTPVDQHVEHIVRVANWLLGSE